MNEKRTPFQQNQKKKNVYRFGINRHLVYTHILIFRQTHRHHSVKYQFDKITFSHFSCRIEYSFDQKKNHAKYALSF